MICLTGDIHHASLRINDQQFIPDPNDSEVKIAARYLRLVERRRLKVTFYTCGKALEEEWDDFRPIAESAAVEIGGHTYDGLPLDEAEKRRYEAAGLTAPSHAAAHGSRDEQWRDIARSIEIVKARTGRPMESWRSHGLVKDEHTHGLLAEAGIRTISDEISATKLGPETLPEGLVSLPMNVMMDHDHLFHAHRDAAFVAAAKTRGYGADAFGDDSYEIAEWGERVEKQVRDILQHGGVATVLMHPICQFLADEFRTAERLLDIFEKHNSIFAKEAPQFAR